MPQADSGKPCTDFAVCDSILVQKIRLVSRENSKEDYLLLINPQTTDHDGNGVATHLPAPPANPSLQDGVTLVKEASHPLGTSYTHTPTSNPSQLEFASSSYPFDSTLDQLASAHPSSHSATTSGSSPSSTQSVSFHGTYCPPNPQPTTPMQYFSNGSINGSKTWPVNGESGALSTVSVGTHATTSGRYNLSCHQHPSSDCQLPSELSECRLESKGSRTSARSVTRSQHSLPAGEGAGTVVGTTQPGSRPKENRLTGGVAWDGEEEDGCEVERDRPHNGKAAASVVPKDAAKLAPVNVFKKDLPSKLAEIGKKLTHKNILEKRGVPLERLDEEGEEMKSQSAGELEQRTSGTTPLRTRKSDPVKPVYLKKKSLLDISRAFSEPSQVSS